MRPDTKHARISFDAADTSRCYNRRDHDGHGMATAFGARLFLARCGPQEAPISILFPISTDKGRVYRYQGIARLRPVTADRVKQAA